MNPEKTVIYFIALVLLYTVFHPSQHRAVAIQPESPVIQYIVSSGDSLSTLASVFDVQISEIKNWNGLVDDTLQNGQKLTIASPVFSRPSKGLSYTVIQGDTLAGIARQYNLSQVDIIQANQLSSSSLIDGQVLFIPRPYESRQALGEQYTGEEWVLLAKIIHAESFGEPAEGQTAVGGVVINRIFSGSFPKTIKGVIFQPGQFTPAGSGEVKATPNSADFIAAKRALQGDDPSKGGLFFANLALARPETRAMFEKLTITVVIGHHTFGK